MKRLALAVGLLVLLLGGLELALRRAVDQLAQVVSIEQVEHGLLHRELRGVSRGPLQVERVRWELLHPNTVDIEGLRLQLRPELGEGEDKGRGGEVPTLPDWLNLEVRGLDLYWGEDLLARGLEGGFRGEAGVVSGDGVALTLEGRHTGELMFVRELPLEELSGPVLVEASWSPRVLDLRVKGEDLLLRHELLSRQALPLPLVVLTLEGDPREGPAKGRGQLGDLPFTFALECPDTGCSLDVEVPDSPAGWVLAPMEPLVPELRRGRVTGMLGGHARIWQEQGELAWELQPRIGELQVHGAVGNLGELRGGRFRYRAFDSEGQPLERLSGEGSADWVPLRAVSPAMRAAVVAAEDSAFYRHAGYNPESITQALEANREAGQVVRGGSTLTQQLAKNLYLDGERTLERKLRELLLAIELDRELGKDRVLELYLNVVEWGPDVWGVGPASELYFLRQPAALPPHEAAFLAALLPAPRRYYQQWYLRDRASELRIDWILQNMADGEAISQDQARRYMREPLRLVPPPRQ